jgi:hypothetical protein
MQFKKFLQEYVDPDISQTITKTNFIYYTPKGWTAKDDGPLPYFRLYLEPNRKWMDVEMATPHHPQILPALQELLQHFPQLSDYNLVFDGHQAGVLKDFIKQPYTEIPDNFYHGTCLYYAEIAMKEGLKPRRTTNGQASFVGGAKESNPSLVYLSSDDGNDVRFASREASSKCSKQLGYYSPATILKINGDYLNPSKIMPDEDSNTLTWKSSLHVTGTIGYEGIIPSQAISLHMIIKNGKWEKT